MREIFGVLGYRLNMEWKLVGLIKDLREERLVKMSLTRLSIGKDESVTNIQIGVNERWDSKCVHLHHGK